MHPQIAIDLAFAHRNEMLAQARRFAPVPKKRRHRNRLRFKVSARKRQFAT